AEELRGDAADFAQTAGANHGSAAAETEDVGGHRAGEVPAVTERGEGYTHGLGAARAVDQAGAGRGHVLLGIQGVLHARQPIRRGGGVVVEPRHVASSYPGERSGERTRVPGVALQTQHFWLARMLRDHVGRAV